MDHGARVRYYRKLRRMTQNELAEAADLSCSYIAKVEAGTRTLGRGGAVSIARALDVPVGEVITYDEEENDFHESQGPHKIFEVLSDCSPYELNIIGDMVAQLKKTLRANEAVI